MTIMLWDLKDPSKHKLIADYDDTISSIALSNDNKFVISGSLNEIMYWSLEAPYKSRLIGEHRGWVNSVVIS